MFSERKENHHDYKEKFDILSGRQANIPSFTKPLFTSMAQTTIVPTHAQISLFTGKNKLRLLEAVAMHLKSLPFLAKFWPFGLIVIFRFGIRIRSLSFRQRFDICCGPKKKRK